MVTMLHHRTHDRIVTHMTVCDTQDLINTQAKFHEIQIYALFERFIMQKFFSKSQNFLFFFTGER